MFSSPLESIVFLVTGIAFFVWFFPIAPGVLLKGKKKEEVSRHTSHTIIPSARSVFFEFLSSSSYYFAMVFFYISYYGIIYSIAPMTGFSVPFLYGGSTCLILAISFLSFHFYTGENTIFSKIFYSNTLVFSLVYTTLLLYSIFLQRQWSDVFFLINAISSLAALGYILLRRKDFPSGTPALFLLIFLIFLIPFYIGTVILQYALLPFAIVLLSFLSLIFSDGLQIFVPLKKYREITTITAILVSYWAIILSVVYSQLHGIYIAGLLFLLFHIAFQSYIHSKYNAPISFFVAVASIWFVLFEMFYPSNPGSGFFLYILFVFLIAALFALWGMVVTQHRYDPHTLFGVGITHTVGFFVFSLFRFENLGILEISVFFLWFSVLLFVTYLRFKPT